jgi:Ring finger domain
MVCNYLRQIALEWFIFVRLCAYLVVCSPTEPLFQAALAVVSGIYFTSGLNLYSYIATTLSPRSSAIAHLNIILSNAHRRGGEVQERARSALIVSDLRRVAAMETVFATWPLQAAHFFRCVIVTSFVTGSILSAATISALNDEGAFLNAYSVLSKLATRIGWHTLYQSPDTFVQIWCIGRVFLFTLQLPFRIQLFVALSNAVKDPTNRLAAITQLIELCQWRSWRVNQQIGLTLYGWFFAGLPILFGYSTLAESKLYIYVLCNYIAFALHMVVSFVWLRSILIQEAPGIPFAEFNGASKQDLEQHTITELFNSEAADGDDSCSICLNEFAHGEEVRKLSCEHLFHTACVAEWLIKSRLCPLCRQDIVSRPSSAMSHPSDQEVS